MSEALKDGSDSTIEIEAFPGRAPVRIDPRATAPFGWWAALVVALVAFVDRVEYNLVAGALPAIQDHFHFGDTVAGAIPTASAIAGVLLLLPAGRLADRGRRTSIVGLVVLTWAACSVLSGVATTFALFFASRILLGAAGQLYNPPASSLLADYYPARSRGKAFGFERAGYYLGLPIGVALGGALAEALGWRSVFLVVAVPGVIVALLVFALREPLRGLGDRLDRWTAAGEPVPAAATPAHAVTASMVAEARDVLRIRSLAGIIGGLSLLYLGLGGLFYWLPTFLERTEGLEYDAAAGLAGGVGGTGIVIGIILGGRLGDRHHGTRSAWRLRVGVGFLALGAVSLTCAVLLSGLPVRLTLITLACVGFAGAIPNLTAASADVVPARRRGVGFAMLQLVTTLGGAAGPLAIGLLSDAVGSLRIALLALVPPLFGAIVLLSRTTRHYDEDARGALEE
jgi:MFS family permease